MTRNTHHRERDHFGEDLLSNIVLGSDIERYPAGTTLEVVLADLVARAAALEDLVANITPFHVNAVLKRAQSGSFVASAVIFNGGGDQFTFDAIVRRGRSGSFTANAVIA